MGAIIKGTTDHYHHVARIAQDGVLSVALKYNLALGNGILTVHTLEQALARADGPMGNIGFDAASAACDLRGLFHNFPIEIVLNHEERKTIISKYCHADRIPMGAARAYTKKDRKASRLRYAP